MKERFVGCCINESQNFRVGNIGRKAHKYTTISWSIFNKVVADVKGIDGGTDLLQRDVLMHINLLMHESCWKIELKDSLEGHITINRNDQVDNTDRFNIYSMLYLD